MILVIAGHSGAGKSTIAAALANRLAVEPIEVGQTVRSFHARDASPLTLIDYADQQFACLGPLCFIGPALDGRTNSAFTVIVGLRRIEEYEYVRNRDVDARLLWLDALSKVREARKTEGKSSKYFNYRTTKEHAWGLDDLRNIADLILTSTDTVASLTERIAAWLKQE